MHFVLNIPIWIATTSDKQQSPAKYATWKNKSEGIFVISVSVISCCFVKQTITTGISVGADWMRAAIRRNLCFLYSARLNFLSLCDPEILYGPVINLPNPTATKILPKYLERVETGLQENLPGLFLLLLFNGWESTEPWFLWSSASSPWKEGENSDKMWQADSCSLRLLWKARQALFVWWEMLWRKTDGGWEVVKGERESERRRAVQNENETAKCWTVWRDLLQIDFCKLARFFFPGEMKGNDRGILITGIFIFYLWRWISLICAHITKWNTCTPTNSNNICRACGAIFNGKVSADNDLKRFFAICRPWKIPNITVGWRQKGRKRGRKTERFTQQVIA